MRVTLPSLPEPTTSAGPNIAAMTARGIAVSSAMAAFIPVMTATALVTPSPVPAPILAAATVAGSLFASRVWRSDEHQYDIQQSLQSRNLSSGAVAPTTTAMSYINRAVQIGLLGGFALTVSIAGSFFSEHAYLVAAAMSAASLGSAAARPLAVGLASYLFAKPLVDRVELMQAFNRAHDCMSQLIRKFELIKQWAEANPQDEHSDVSLQILHFTETLNDLKAKIARLQTRELQSEAADSASSINTCLESLERQLEILRYSIRNATGSGGES